MQASSDVDIRRYFSVPEFQADAVAMAAAGWNVVAQTETTPPMGGGWVLLAIIAAIFGLFVFWPLLLLVILALVVGMSTRGRQLLVTYRYERKAEAPSG